ncbi:unnamed protein product [Ceratitis capitata]|uniref:(Mediterranean fruit fly) hypothetical protein n=1 Tax=Ceratitis capitata TaxID=7213 RepID=A0A811V4K7_CERCA|nr:unnamed protein product [Ceratitis capitata]
MSNTLASMPGTRCVASQCCIEMQSLGIVWLLVGWCVVLTSVAGAASQQIQSRQSHYPNLQRLWFVVRADAAGPSRNPQTAR